MHRVGIVGLGGIAQKVYLPLLSNNPRIDVVGVVSRTREKAELLAARYRIGPVYGRVEELVAKRPDIVFVHTSTAAHTAVVSECLAADIPVYVDKPVSENIEETRWLEQEARRRSLLLAVGLNRRFAPLVRSAASFVTSPSLVVVEKHRTSLQSRPAHETVYDDYLHIVDLAHWVGGPALSVERRDGVVDDQGRLRTVTTTLSRPGLQVQLSMTRDAGADTERVFLAGHGRSAAVVDLESAVLQEGGKTTVKSFGSWDDILTRRGFAGIVDHVLDTVDSPDKCEVSITAVLDMHSAVDKIADAVRRPE